MITASASPLLQPARFTIPRMIGDRSGVRCLGPAWFRVSQTTGVQDTESAVGAREVMLLVAEVKVGASSIAWP